MGLQPQQASLVYLLLSLMKRKLIQNYALHEVLGEGSFGKVYKGVHTVSNQHFAIKVIPVQKFQENSRLEECSANEIKNLTMIESSPHIIKFVEMLKTSNNFYFVYEFCNGKTLQAKLKDETKLTQAEAFKIFNQLLEAFKILNKYNIMHRDLKPDNIFFHDGHIKLGDFGFCKTLLRQGDMTSTMLGSPIYMAPQVLRGQIYTSKADIWSLGVVLYEMLFGVCPFESNSIAKLIAALDNDQLKFPADINPISQSTKSLLKKLLTKDQFKRIDWFQLLTMNTNSNQYVFSPTESLSTIDSKALSWDLGRKLSVNSCEISSKSAQISTGIPCLNAGINNGFVFKKKSDQNQVGVGKLNPQINRTPKTIGSNFFPEQSQHHRLCQTSLSPRKHQPLQKVETNIYSSPDLQKKISNVGTQTKRRQLLNNHNSCLVAVKTAINFMKSNDPSYLVYSLLIFRRVEYLMRRITDSIGFSQLDLEDLLSTVSQELKPIERQVKQLQNELVLLKVDLAVLVSPKPVLKSRFNNQANTRLWYEMIMFLTEQAMNPRSTEVQWSTTISNYLA